VDEFKLLFLKLRRLLHSRGHKPDESEDLIQEAFLRLQQYNCERVVRHKEAFLVRTVLNLLTDRRRQRRPVMEVVDGHEALSLVDPNPEPDAILEGQRRMRRFQTGLRALSPRQREVFILNRIEGHSFAQIAAKLGITVSMAEKHAARALLFLGDWMERELDREERGGVR